jgi:hypothetical protein
MQLKKVCSFLGEKRPGHKVKHPIPSSTAVKNKLNYASISPYAFTALTGTTIPYVGCHTMFDWYTYTDV